MPLIVYPKRPLLGQVEAATPWRVDAIELSPLSNGQVPPSSELVKLFAADVLDRQEHTVPAELLAKLDLERGWADAVARARS